MKDIHTEHCCVIHGCKYGGDIECPVMRADAKQSYVCERCERDGIDSLLILDKVMEGKIPLCRHCGHIHP